MTTPLEEVIAAARAAVASHSAGYAIGVPWNADGQLQLMDALGEALERMDDAIADRHPDGPRPKGSGSEASRAAVPEGKSHERIVMSTPDKNYITEATELFARVFNCEESELVFPGAASPIALIATEFSRIATQARQEGIEAAAKVAKLEINKVLVAVSETELDQETVEMAERPEISGHDAAQLGWFACWRAFTARLDGISPALSSTPTSPKPSVGEQ